MTRGQSFGALVVFGAGWGLTIPLGKIVIMAGHSHFGLVFWQMAVGVIVLGAIQIVRRRPMPITAKTLGFCLVIALIGTIVPNSMSYRAAFYLPAGIMALVIALVPMVAFPIALMFGIDRFSIRRFAGLLLGLSAMALIALPEASLPEGAAVVWVFVALIAPFCYAFEGNLVARFGTAGLGPIQTLFGASVIGSLVMLPVALGTGQFIVPSPTLGSAGIAILGIGVIHALVYTGYVWLVGQTGAVFAAQVAYLVTGFGVVWSMVLLGERYPPTVWIAFGVLMVGLVLVQPRLAPDASPVDDGAGPDISGPPSARP